MDGEEMEQMKRVERVKMKEIEGMEGEGHLDHAMKKKKTKTEGERWIIWDPNDPRIIPAAAAGEKELPTRLSNKPPDPNESKSDKHWRKVEESLAFTFLNTTIDVDRSFQISPVTIFTGEDRSRKLNSYPFVEYARFAVHQHNMNNNKNKEEEEGFLKLSRVINMNRRIIGPYQVYYITLEAADHCGGVPKIYQACVCEPPPFECMPLQLACFREKLPDY